ncbi:hypothetical protein JCM19379_08520 [Methyloparacoccus murrellii]|jgi:hypothetical protein
MIQPVDLKDFLLTFFVSAGIILSGACYALFYAWGRLRGRAAFLRGAWLAYAVLVACTLTLVQTAHLNGSWSTLALLMLAGYFAAPRAIFRLCADTHAVGHPKTASIAFKEKTP